MDFLSRGEVIQAVALKVAQLELLHPVRVGVDGVSASGKTLFADELAGILSGMGRQVVRAGLDGFHNPPEVRHRLGPLSVEGYMEDSFNHAAVRECVLDPLGPEGDLRYRSEVYDHGAEESRQSEFLLASSDSILIFEGVMLFRAEIVDCFDFKILVQTSFEVALERAKVRDLEHFGSLDTLLEKYTQRFIPGQALYIERSRPGTLADCVVWNDDLLRPKLKFLK